ncbi:hypothetical protein BDN70DRAFT_934388 [Pholiota conissans]|uniref:F-box domain-containing protein n=1 Tax=Pholiota conissans TaxID=109636 RepID=A0A9P5Z0F3_9AGAR|nr:hypothetical protein BDN70DRAFT_934388 [Pholiota conissans]
MKTAYLDPSLTLASQTMSTSGTSLNSFPYELLSIIHEDAVISFEPPSLAPRLDSETRSNISLVCKTWRENILENGPIWATGIDAGQYSFARAQELIRRAKASPLAISSRDSYVDDESLPPQDFESQTWKYVFNNAAQWNTFYLETDLNSRCNLDDLKNGLQRPMPKLESFTIRNKYREIPGDDSYDAEEEFELPENLFESRAPCLKEFNVTDVYFPPSFNFGIWANLTYLRVANEAQGNDLTYQIYTNWCEILRPLKNLEVLELVDIFYNFVEKGPSFEDTPDIQFNHLSKLYLSTDTPSGIIFDIFAKVVVPNTCSISMNIHNVNIYPPFAFERLRIGLYRLVENLAKDHISDQIFVTGQQNIECSEKFEHDSVSSYLSYVPRELSSKEELDKRLPNFQFNQAHHARDLPCSVPPFSASWSSDPRSPASDCQCWRLVEEVLNAHA